MTKFSDKKREQDKARRAKELPEQVKRLEGRINGLEAALAEHASRLDALEVVRVPSPTVDPDEARRHDVAGTTFEAQMDLDEPQRPETE